MEFVQKPGNQLISSNTGTPPRPTLHKAVMSDDHISLEQNQIIRGLVTDIRPGEISIRLANKQAVMAHLEGNNEVSIGDVASFRIVENKNGEITLLKLNSSVTPEEITIFKALEEANLPASPVNMEIVKELLYHKLPINKESINMILKQSIQFKDAKVSTLVFMIKNELPMEEGFIKTFEQYRNFDYRLLDNIENTKEGFLSFISQASTYETEGSFLSFSTKLMEFLGVQRTTMDAVNDAQDFSSIHANIPNDAPLNFNGKEQAQLLQLFSPYDLPEDFIQSIENNTENLRDLVHHIREALTTAVASSPAEVEPFKTPLILNIMEQYGNLQQSNGEIASFLSTNQRLLILDTIQDFPLSISDAAAIANGEISSAELLSLVSNFVTPEYAKSLRKLFASEPFQKLLSHQMIADLCLTPERLKEQNVVDKYYSDILDKMDKMKALTTSDSITTNPASFHDKVESVKTNFDYMKTFNQLFTYVQLPVKLSNQITHGDLYVYTNKEKLKTGTDQISVLLHLDMDNLGPLDIHLSLRSSSIQSKFYVKKKEIKTLLMKHEDELKTSLAKIGYQLTMEIYQQTKDVDILKDLTETNTPTTQIKRYSFDIRA